MGVRWYVVGRKTKGEFYSWEIISEGLVLTKPLYLQVKEGTITKQIGAGNWGSFCVRPVYLPTWETELGWLTWTTTNHHPLVHSKGTDGSMSCKDTNWLYYHSVCSIEGTDNVRLGYDNDKHAKETGVGDRFCWGDMGVPCGTAIYSGLLKSW